MGGVGYGVGCPSSLSGYVGPLGDGAGDAGDGGGADGAGSGGAPPPGDGSGLKGPSGSGPDTPSEPPEGPRVDPSAEPPRFLLRFPDADVDLDELIASSNNRSAGKRATNSRADAWDVEDAGARVRGRAVRARERARTRARAGLRRCDLPLRLRATSSYPCTARDRLIRRLERPRRSLWQAYGSCQDTRNRQDILNLLEQPPPKMGQRGAELGPANEGTRRSVRERRPSVGRTLRNRVSSRGHTV